MCLGFLHVCSFCIVLCNFCTILSKVLQNWLCGYETVFMAAMLRDGKTRPYPHGGVAKTTEYTPIFYNLVVDSVGNGSTGRQNRDTVSHIGETK